VEWNAPDFSLHQVTGDDGRTYRALETPGWIQTQEPGQPRLPFASALAVVPPTSEVVLHTQVLERVRYPLSYPVLPAYAPVPVGSPSTSFEWTWTRDEHTYAGTRLYPADIVTLEEAGWMRGRRLVRLTFYPLRFNPLGNTLEVASRVRLELDFSGQPPDVTQGEPITDSGWASDDPFASVLQASVINPAQVNDFVRLQQIAPATVTMSGPGTAADGRPHDEEQVTAPGETEPVQALAYPPAGTEYLIIAHSNFMAAVAPLASHRAISDGLHVFSTTVQAVYGGQPANSLLIRDYISRTYHSGVTPTLKYVLLVGDGTQDGSGGQYIPPYMITDIWGNPTASDNRFVTVDGTDNLADIFIGRLPVNTVVEATTVVNKILAYELNPPQWPWNKRVLFFAGHEQDAPYHEYSDQVYATLPVTYSGQRAYFCTLEHSGSCNEPYKYTDMDDAYNATLQALNAGGLLASYVGHASWRQWDWDPRQGDDFLQPMFHLDHISNLYNGGALPVVLEMTCYTSDFSYPQFTTFDEVLLRRVGGGAVATWGPTTLGDTQGHRLLHQGFFDAVFQNHETELGTIIEEARLRLPGYLSDMHDVYVLLGDPAMDLNLNIVPWPTWNHRVFIPVALRGYR